ncbi:MAG: hypothetical protein H6907_10455 [Hyphomicrobiales bacterium]|nr:hypothetical protein [Hyphomicrobiales bacterium]
MKHVLSAWFAALCLTLSAATLPAATATAAEAPMQPFVLAAAGPGDLAAKVAEVTAKLTGAGFQVAGSYSPYADATVIVVTSDALKAAAAKSKFGGYGAGQRVSVTKVGDQVQVAYTNPAYMAAAYRMDDDLAGTAAALAKALGHEKEYGAAKEAMTADELRKYHYMFGMEYFTEPSTLNTFASHQAALDTVEKNLAAGLGGVTKVYRIDIPGREETVFGVAMDGGKGEGTMQDDAYIMGKIDFQPLRSTAHLPYEILVSGDTAYALYARFRIAINFPDLSMMGSNSFMSIMDSPATIERALTRIAGGKVKKTP